MITISLCMIVRNEEEVLARCLDSVLAAVDEIIVVDTGSTDRTREIAAEYGAKVFEFPWIDDFAAARNASFDLATREYQFWLDADDTLPPEELGRLLALKSSLEGREDVVTMLYHTAFDPNGAPTHSFRRGRLFRRAAGFRWLDPIHEYIPQSGIIRHSDVAVHHRKHGTAGDRNLRIYDALRERGTAFSPRQQYYYARELMTHGRHSEAAERFTAFLDGGGGWVEDNIAACVCLSHCRRALGGTLESLLALTRSFYYAPPRSEVCCELGYFHQRRGALDAAVYWFTQALTAPSGDGTGFTSPECAGYIPHIELCVCHCRLGAFDLAREHNERAAEFKPGDPAVEHNRVYLRDRLANVNN